MDLETFFDLATGPFSTNEQGHRSRLLARTGPFPFNRTCTFSFVKPAAQLPSPELKDGGLLLFPDG